MSNARNLARLLPNTSGQLPDAAMASGSVLQVVSTTFNSQVVATTSSFVATGCSLSITPTSSTSKIVCLFTGWGSVSGSGIHGIASIFRNGSVNLNGPYGNNFFTDAGGYTEFPIALSAYDTPNTTNETTYEIYIRQDGVANFAFGGGNNRISTFTLMEIAA